MRFWLWYLDIGFDLILADYLMRRLETEGATSQPRLGRAWFSSEGLSGFCRAVRSVVAVAVGPSKHEAGDLITTTPTFATVDESHDMDAPW